MTKKRKKDGADDSVPQLSMTPMIDIVFQLLIFFMLGCKMKSDEGRLKAYLPKGSGLNNGLQEEPVDLQTLRIKLLWADRTGRPYELRRADTSFEKYFERVQNGRVILKVGENIISNVNSEWPDYNRLRNIITEAKSDYRPPHEKPDKKLPVIIDARESVPWKHVVAALNAAMKAGINDITFAAPENPY